LGGFGVTGRVQAAYVLAMRRGRSVAAHGAADRFEGGTGGDQGGLGIDPVAADVPDWLGVYLAMEQSATELRSHESRAAHELLQTAAYAEHMLRNSSSGADVDIERAVEQRLLRQQRVRDGRVSLDVIQPEGALHLQVGHDDVMAEQYEAMVELAQLPNVTVRVVCFAAGHYEARRLGDYTVMAHPWGTPRVHIEDHYWGGRFLPMTSDVGAFARAFDAAAEIALPPVPTIEYLRQLATNRRTPELRFT
jgi:hypothetical protein